jgi:hypothetical protein
MDAVIFAALIAINVGATYGNVLLFFRQRRHEAGWMKREGEMLRLVAFVTAIAESNRFPPALRLMARTVLPAWVTTTSVAPAPQDPRPSVENRTTARSILH